MTDREIARPHDSTRIDEDRGGVLRVSPDLLYRYEVAALLEITSVVAP